MNDKDRNMIEKINARCKELYNFNDEREDMLWLLDLIERQEAELEDVKKKWLVYWDRADEAIAALDRLMEKTIKSE